MKIVHLSTAKSWRGGEQQLLYLSRGLKTRGVDQLLLAPAGAPLHERAAKDDLPTRPFESGFELNPLTALRLRSVLREEKADLVHAHDGHGVAFAALGGRGVRRVCTRRVDFPLNSRWKYAWGMDRVICISGAIQRICGAAGLDDSVLPVVPSGINPDRLKGEYHTRELAASFGFDRRDPVILNVASLTDHKGQCYLLEAMLLVAAKHPRAKLLIAGAGELEEALKRQATTLALEERVRFLGFRNDLGALYSLADLFVMSSHLEGLCTSVLDAMAMGRACVVTDAGGLPELITNGTEGKVVPAKDPEALAKAMSALLDDRKLREKMGKAGRRKAREEFSMDRMVEGTLAVYRDLLGEAE